MDAHITMQHQGAQEGQGLGAKGLCGAAEVGELGGVDAGDAHVDGLELLGRQVMAAEGQQPPPRQHPARRVEEPEVVPVADRGDVSVQRTGGAEDARGDEGGRRVAAEVALVEADAEEGGGG